MRHRHHQWKISGCVGILGLRGGNTNLHKVHSSAGTPGWQGVVNSVPSTLFLGSSIIWGRSHLLLLNIQAIEIDFLHFLSGGAVLMPIGGSGGHEVPRACVPSPCKQIENSPVRPISPCRKTCEPGMGFLVGHKDVKQQRLPIQPLKRWVQHQCSAFTSVLSLRASR